MVRRCMGVETENFGCLSNREYESRRNALARDHRARTPFTNQWGLATINADKAWADAELLRGAAAPGSGVNLGFIDTGIDHGHPLFQGKTIPETFLRTGTGLAVNEDGRTRFSHGTATASIAVAAPGAACAFSTAGGDCAEFRGVAWGANLRMFAIRLGTAQPGRIVHAITPSRLGSNDADDAAVYGRVLGEDLDILNLSFGYYGVIDGYTAADLRANYGRAIAALAQADAERKTILVWSAGNSNGDLCLPGSLHCVGSDRTGIDPRDPADCLNNDPPNCVSKPAGSLDARSPNLLSGLMARIEELRGHSVAVVAVGSSGAIADFSNRCGEAADWCVAAPGADIQVAYFGPACSTGSRLLTGVCRGAGTTIPALRAIVQGGGTSFAAPLVSGGLAVMRHVFRDQLTSEELLTRLFRTANKSGIYANRAIYGQGLMDLGAATNPVGELQVVAGGGSVGDSGHPLSATRLSMGGPLGDGLATSLGGVELAAIDALGAPFWFDSSALALPSGGGISNERRLHDLIAPRRKRRREASGHQDRAGWRFGFYKSPVASESSLFDLAENAATVSYRTPGGLEATAFAASGLTREKNESPDAGLALAWRPPASGLGARLGWLREEDSALGSKADGAFGRLSADSFVAGVEAEAALGGWTLAAEAEAGFSRIHAGGGMIAGFSDVTTSALALSARRRLSPRDALTLSVSQPPRVESGRARLSLPVGRTWSGTILRRPVLADMAPSGRQIDLSMRWRRANVWSGELSLEAIWSRHPGHVEKKPELGLLAGWRMRW